MTYRLTSTTLLLTAAMLSASVSAQFPPEGAQPSPEEMRAIQEEAMKMVTPMVEAAFNNSDADDNGSLDKDEMLEFSIEMIRAQARAMAERGLQAPQVSEEQLSQMKEQMKPDIEARFTTVDTDESGGISQEEVFKAMFGDAYQGEDKAEEPAGTSNDDANASDDS